jgi:hypothetical protein
LIKVFSLTAPAERLLSPRMILATIRGPRSTAPAEPPFTAAELEAVGRSAAFGPRPAEPR